jgi:ADP-ribosyl-[dinitrogen reductase] hydrolase
MHGSCLCGAIEYEAAQLDGPIEHCSCRTCRKAHAAAFNSAAPVKHEHFRWIKGQELLSGHRSSPQKNRLFCSKCGSQLVAQLDGRDYMLLRVATLDDDPGKAPQRHIWTSQQVPWLRYGAPVPAYPEWEPGHE